MIKRLIKKVLITFLSLILSMIELSAGPRVLDDNPEPPLSAPVAFIGSVIMTILFGLLYLNSKDKDGKRDEGCGCLFLMGIATCILGYYLVSK